MQRTRGVVAEAALYTRHSRPVGAHAVASKCARRPVLRIGSWACKVGAAVAAVATLARAATPLDEVLLQLGTQARRRGVKQLLLELVAALGGLLDTLARG